MHYYYYYYQYNNMDRIYFGSCCLHDAIHHTRPTKEGMTVYLYLSNFFF